MYGFSFAWILQEVGNPAHFIVQVKQRLKDCYSQKWHEDINMSSRCDFYAKFKTLLNVERYLYTDISFYCKRS